MSLSQLLPRRALLEPQRDAIFEGTRLHARCG